MGQERKANPLRIILMAIGGGAILIGFLGGFSLLGIGVGALLMVLAAIAK